MMKAWFKSGSPWIWMTAGAVSINLLLVLCLLILIAIRGLGHFWPADIVEYHYQDKSIGQRDHREQVDERCCHSSQGGPIARY